MEFISIAGLAVRMSLCLFVFQLVGAVCSSDAFPERKDRIYAGSHGNLAGPAAAFGALSAPAAVLFADLIGVLAGLVLAAPFSKFDPAVVLRDVAKARLFSRLTLRRGLAVFQFFVYFFFIITTTVIYKQFRRDGDTIESVPSKTPNQPESYS